MPGYGLARADAGDGLLPWTWAEERLSRSHNYWFSSSSEGKPHTMPVWGIWWRDSFVFSTGSVSRKARNLAGERRCTVATEHAAEAVVVEGVAALVREAPLLVEIGSHYKSKYTSGFPSDSSVYRVTPRVVFGIIESSPGFTNSTTRWQVRPAT
jgi:hypothetical protein